MSHPVILYEPEKSMLEFTPKEVGRYLGYGNNAIPDNELQLINRGIEQVREIMTGKACYSKFPVSFLSGDKIQLPYGIVKSKHLTRNLIGCSEIYIFAATIGTEFDRLLQRTRVRSLAEAVTIQACGAAAVEGVCNSLNETLRLEMQKEGRALRPRYSPGFGDYTLDNQKGIFALIEPARTIGLTLMDSFTMAPEKSVTAIIGIEE